MIKIAVAEISSAKPNSNLFQNSMSTLNPETWTNMSKHLLSKTRPQEIKVRAAFNNVEVPIIVGSNASTIASTVPDFNDMFDNTLMKNKDQEVKAKWTFDTLKVLGNNSSCV